MHWRLRMGAESGRRPSAGEIGAEAVQSQTLPDVSSCWQYDPARLEASFINKFNIQLFDTSMADPLYTLGLRFDCR